MLSKFNADSIDEVTCARGDMVQLLNINHAANRFLIYKPPGVNTPGMEGWIPGLPIG